MEEKTIAATEKKVGGVYRPLRDVGIVGYGAYVPRYRLPASEINRIWRGGEGGTPIKEKAVPGLDEDVVTMSIEAARNALGRADINPAHLRAVWIGSESHPYAVKPSSTIVSEAIGASPHVLAGDWEFACKAGTEAMQAAIGLVGSGMAEYAMAIGMDTAQGRPGDALEYTAAAGGAAYILGPAEESLAIFKATYSYVTDTPDFWRREHEVYPSHGDRFTGDPGYFGHIIPAAKHLMEEMDMTAEDFAYVVFHQPNLKFPIRAARQLGFKQTQYETGLLCGEVGNTYAGSMLLGLTAILDVAKPGEKIFFTSYGSGAGSDAGILEVTKRIEDRRNSAPSTSDYIARRTEIDYALYVRFRRKLRK